MIEKGREPPQGYAPIPGSKHGGYHKLIRGQWHSWYADGSGSVDNQYDPGAAAPVTGGRELKLSRKQLDKLLFNGHYSLISAGPNNNDPDEKGMANDDPKFAERHKRLRDDITALGLNYTEAEGHWGGSAPEDSLVVYHLPERDQKRVKVTRGEKRAGSKHKTLIVHHVGSGARAESQYAKIRKLGEKYNQDAVIHSKNGHHETHYTTGPHVGKHTVGSGFAYDQEAPNFYSKVPITEAPGHSKFRLNLSRPTTGIQGTKPKGPPPTHKSFDKSVLKGLGAWADSIFKARR